jgi:hypothetical protein
MNGNAELDALRVLWQAGPEAADPAELRRRVMQGTRRRKVMLLGPVLVTVGIGGWIALRTLASPTPANAILAAETWLYIAAAWAIGLWIDRGTWRPVGDTTRAFIELEIRRCRSTLTSLRVYVPLYLLQLSAVMSWQIGIAGLDASRLLQSWPMVLLGWIGLPSALVFSTWYSRRKTRELAGLVRLREQFLQD